MDGCARRRTSRRGHVLRLLDLLAVRGGGHAPGRRPACRSSSRWSRSRARRPTSPASPPPTGSSSWSSGSAGRPPRRAAPPRRSLARADAARAAGAEPEQARRRRRRRAADGRARAAPGGLAALRPTGPSSQGRSRRGHAAEAPGRARRRTLTLEFPEQASSTAGWRRTRRTRRSSRSALRATAGAPAIESCSGSVGSAPEPEKKPPLGERGLLALVKETLDAREVGGGGHEGHGHERDAPAGRPDAGADGKAQEDLKNEVVEASAGGGMVTVVATGTGRSGDPHQARGDRPGRPGAARRTRSSRGERGAPLGAVACRGAHRRDVGGLNLGGLGLPGM